MPVATQVGDPAHSVEGERVDGSGDEDAANVDPVRLKVWEERGEGSDGGSDTADVDPVFDMYKSVGGEGGERR